MRSWYNSGKANNWKYSCYFLSYLLWLWQSGLRRPGCPQRPRQGSLVHRSAPYLLSYSSSLFPFPYSSLPCATLLLTFLLAAVPLSCECRKVCCPECAARLPVPHSLCRTLAFPWRISQPHRLHWLVESGRGVAIATALILKISFLDVTWHWSVAQGQPKTQLNGFHLIIFV